MKSRKRKKPHVAGCDQRGTTEAEKHEKDEEEKEEIISAKSEKKKKL